MDGTVSNYCKTTDQNRTIRPFSDTSKNVGKIFIFTRYEGKISTTLKGIKISDSRRILKNHKDELVFEARYKLRCI